MDWPHETVAGTRTGVGQLLLAWAVSSMGFGMTVQEVNQQNVD